MNIAAAITAPIPLVRLPLGRRAAVTAIEWERLSAPESRRLRELGLDEGVEVELMHKGGILGGPVACRIGRMTVALRRHVAAAILVEARSGA